jgi:DNA-binding transcriptional ArsR family regulator
MDEHGGSAVPVDQLTRTFAALADPTRRAILARLAEGDATVGDLAEPFPISVQAVSKHLKVLERAGLITRGRTAQLRPSRLHGAPLKEAADWLEPYRVFWEGSFDRLEARLRTGDPPGPGERRAGATATGKLGADA